MGITNPFKEGDRQIINQLLQKGLDKRRGEENLFIKYAYFIKEGMNKHGLPEEDSFNAYSDSVLAAIEEISDGSFEGRSSLKTYLYQIFHYKCVDLLRKNTTNKNRIYQTESINDKLSQLSDKARTAIQALIDKADWNLLRERLDRLNGDCRKMLLLWSNSYTDREIALEMEYKTPDVVKTSRLRCLEKLRQLYHIT